MYALLSLRAVRPSFIVGVWRGGTPVGIAVQEILDYLGVQTDHISIRTSAYYGINKRKKRSVSMDWSTLSVMPTGMMVYLSWMRT
jgi:hypoxanthine phosphoribosyltransferase